MTNSYCVSCSAGELIILSAPRHDIAVPSGSQYADDGDFHPTSEPELR